nr:VP1 [Wongorr virus]UBB38846.1 VP1 [Wongorr virus]
MAKVEHRLKATRNALQSLFPGLKIDGTAGVYRYYRYAPWKNKPGEVESERRWQERLSSLYGLPVITEATWEELLTQTHFDTAKGEHALSIYLESILPLNQIEPEEEFLRNYDITDGQRAELLDFVMSRSREECAVYGDLPLKYWCALLINLSNELNHFPMGLQLMRAFVAQYGAPFHQNSRDLSKISDEVVSSTIVLLFEMCVAESIIDLNAKMRMQELGCSSVRIGGTTLTPTAILEELFLVCLPHPKKINNMLRSVYSWYVKTVGVAADKICVLRSSGGDDRNSKDVVYEHFETFDNPYANLLRRSRFHKESQRSNFNKMLETIEYAQTLVRTRLDMPLMQRLMRTVYTDFFDPSDEKHVFIISFMLSIQVISGYGRAWVKNKGDNPEKMAKPLPTNFITRVRDKTRDNFVRAYAEAERHGFTIVKPEAMYSSLLRLAKNTSSGMSTTVEVTKSYTPKQGRPEVVKISSRQKALVIMKEGQKIYSKEYLSMKFNTPHAYQTKGSRDVPIKSTRTIYAIHISILAPQLILTLPLNEYFARHGGPTNPDTAILGGKVIIGDLEATGSRVMDACDTFRNTADRHITTLALDYAEYDQHMTQENFRTGMIQGIRDALTKYHAYEYEGYTVNDMIEFGYGEGRVANTLWNGKRGVMRIRRATYEALPEARRTPPEDAPFKFKRPGVYSVDNFEGLQPEEGDVVLVSPWDGSDLARVSTHLSGENSTLIANSLHNMGIGCILREEIALHHGDAWKVLSEMYVGDDTMWYATYLSENVTEYDAIMKTIFDTVALVGHEASPAKTTCLPFSAEKTQTHAKCGVYIPQDRMMMVSSERIKNIENVAAYMRSNVTTYVTKVSRGFCEELAHRILLFKSSVLGHRKMKRTVFQGTYRSRRFDSNEDGYTLCMIRDPSVLYTPVEWHGYGASPVALNIVMTPELYVDMLQMDVTRDWITPISHLINAHPPSWNEAEAETRQIKTKTEMGLFSKLARGTVTACLMNPITSEAVREIPLQGFGPHSLSHTMMHSALLKEPRARTLLSGGYELKYQEALNGHFQASLDVMGHDLELRTSYAKIFQINMSSPVSYNRREYPDRNLSPSFKLQKIILGNRTGRRLRMAYVDKIDSILRGDVVMRGFITANHIMRLLEDIGGGHTVDDLRTVFSLMNIDPNVAQRLAEYLSKDRTRFDAQKLTKGGVGGDEFTMSLNVMTQQFFDQMVEAPRELFQAERDAVVMHASQILMTLAALGEDARKLKFVVTEEHKKQFRQVRVSSKMPKRRVIRTLCSDVRGLGASIAERQFV